MALRRVTTFSNKISMAKGYGRYDPRFRNLIATTGDIEPFLKFGVPAGTLRENA
jgi:hypothetical protein